MLTKSPTHILLAVKPVLSDYTKTASQSRNINNSTRTISPQGQGNDAVSPAPISGQSI